MPFCWICVCRGRGREDRKRRRSRRYSRKGERVSFVEIAIADIFPSTNFLDDEESCKERRRVWSSRSNDRERWLRKGAAALLNERHSRIDRENRYWQDRVEFEGRRFVRRWQARLSQNRGNREGRLVACAQRQLRDKERLPFFCFFDVAAHRQIRVQLQAPV